MTLDPSLDLFDRLDHFWKNHTGDDIVAILDLAAKRAESTALRVDLCAADLEWRLRIGTQSLTKSSRRAVSRLSAIPRAIDYRKLLGADWELPNVQKHLLEAEWVARSRFGDRPDIDDFALQLPSHTAWRDELASLLDLIAPLRLSFLNQMDETVLSAAVTAEFVIGRAHREEPDPPAWNARKCRAIVAKATFRSLSREQILVRRVRVEEVELVNLSRLIPTQFNKETIKPGEKLRRALPLTLYFTNYRLQICSTSDIEFSLEKKP